MEMKHITCKPNGVCATEISFDLIDGIIHNIVFDGGCAGNTKGITMLAEGMCARDVAERLQNIPCSGGTSCPAELAKSILENL